MTRRASVRIASAGNAGNARTTEGAGALLAACLLAAFQLAAPAAADEYGYRLRDGNRHLFGGPSGVQIYRPQPYRSPLYQPRKQTYDPGWRAAPGLEPLRKPRRDLRPWRPR